MAGPRGGPFGGPRGHSSRRHLLQILAAAGLSLVALPPGRPLSAADPQVRYLTWGGYDAPELFSDYLEIHDEPPEVSVFTGLDEVFAGLSGGLVADVIHPCFEAVPRWREAGLIRAIDTTRLRFWGGVLPELKKLPAIADDDGTWFIPVDWGQTSITYRTDLVDVGYGGESWNMLWDSRYEGRIAVIGLAEDSWWSAAIYAGLAAGPPDEAAFQAVRELLRLQRPLVRFYADDMARVERGLESGELVAAMTWNDTPRRLRERGVPVKFAQPKEGALTWCCGLVLHDRAPAYDKAHDLIDSLISPEVGAYMIETFGFGHANRLSFDRVGEDLLIDSGLSRAPRELLKPAVFVGAQDKEVSARIERDWSEVSGGR